MKRIAFRLLGVSPETVGVKVKVLGVSPETVGVIVILFKLFCIN